jgi:ribosome-associated protein
MDNKTESMIENSAEKNTGKMTREQEYEIAQAMAKALEDKKGMDVTILEVGKKTVLTDYFVIATGTSSTHVNALSDEVSFKIKTESGISPLSVQGKGEWVLMDYGFAVVHVFTEEARKHYNLERLWNDAEVIYE